MSEEKISIGTEGIALEAISVGNTGEAYFPTLAKRAKIYALEDIRKNMDIVIVAANNGAIEHTPEELKYMKVDGTWQRVTESYPLPVTMGSKVVTYKTVKATDSGNTELVVPTSGKKVRVHWYAISNKHTVTVDVGMRFGSGDIKHRYALAAEGGNVTANLTDSCWEGAADETLYAYLDAAYATGVYFNIGYSLE
jgi:hypothetical protein